MARVKGFAEWTVYSKTEPLLADIHGVIEEYREYLPMTIRQVFYRLVGRGYTKSEDFYNQVKEVCSRGRRSGRISFQAIRDDGISHRVVEMTMDTTRQRITTRR